MKEQQGASIYLVWLLNDEDVCGFMAALLSAPPELRSDGTETRGRLVEQFEHEIKGNST